MTSHRGVRALWQALRAAGDSRISPALGMVCPSTLRQAIGVGESRINQYPTLLNQICI